MGVIEGNKIKDRMCCRLRGKFIINLELKFGSYLIFLVFIFIFL